MPTLLNRIGNMILNLGQRMSSQEERAAPPSLQSLIASAGGGIPPSHESHEGLKVYQQNPWVYAALNAIVSELCQIELSLKRRIITNGEVEYEQIHEHQALELLKTPLPKLDGRSHMSGAQLKAITWIHLIGGGEAMWYLGERMMGVPVELHVLQPEYTDVMLGKDNFIEKYRYNINSRQLFYYPEDVVHFRMADPRNIYRGQSALKSAGIAIDTDEESDKFLWNYFKNRAMPDAVIMRQTAPTDDEYARLKSQWDARYKGSSNAGKIGTLWGGMDIKELGRSQRDMQFKELKEFNRDVILANLRIGKGMIGMMEDSNRANADAQDYVFARRVIKPYLTSFAQQLTSEYLPLFGEVEDLEFCFENPVMEDDVSKSTVWGGLLNSGAVSINEVRTKFGLDARDEPMADSLWTGITKIPLSDLEPDEVDGEEPPDDEGEIDAADELTPPEDDPERAMHERINNDESLASLIKKYGGIDNIPLSELDKEEFKRVAALGLSGNAPLLNSAREVEAFRDAASPVYNEAFGTGISLGHDQLSNPAFNAEQIFNMPEARDALQKMKLDFATRTLKATKLDLIKIMDKALAEGQSIQELSKAIADRYGKAYKGYRSTRIARTEGTSAVNAGTHTTLVREGVKTKRWIATSDKSTRDTHLEAHAETERSPIPIEESYMVGGEYADYPGDPSLSAGERINCRCTEVNGAIDSLRGKKVAQLFLRSQGSMERQFEKMIKRAFAQQLGRIQSRFQ